MVKRTENHLGLLRVSRLANLMRTPMDFLTVTRWEMPKHFLMVMRLRCQTVMHSDYHLARPTVNQKARPMENR